MAIDVDESTLKRLAHNAKPLFEAAGLELGHKQCLDFVSRMHGFANFEEAKAKRPPSSVRSDEATPFRLPEGGLAEHQFRRKRVAALAEKLGPMPGGDEQLTLLSDLCSLILTSLAQLFPAELTSKSRKLIREKYPEASDDLMLERSLNVKGLQWAIAMFQQSISMAVCYSPDGTWTQDTKSDESNGDAGAKDLVPAVERAIQSATAAGFSNYGAFVTTLLVAIKTTRYSGLDRVAIFNALQESMTFVWQAKSAAETRLSEQEIIRHLAQQLGVSEKTAAKYAAPAFAKFRGEVSDN